MKGNMSWQFILISTTDMKNFSLHYLYDDREKSKHRISIRQLIE